MYIVSKFRDFYDSAMTYGIDKECVYNREQKEIKLERFRDIMLPSGHEWNQANGITMRADPAVIGFCGKLYPLIHISYSPSNSAFDQFFYDAESYIDFLAKHTTGIDRGRRYFSWFERGDIRYERSVKEFFSYKAPKVEGFFLEHKVPVFIVMSPMRNLKLVLNPRLELYRFMRVMDPASAFQNIYMYKAGVLGNTEKEITVISDKDKLKQHGFDDKSFKTLKGDKKPRRKNRGKSE
jgi:hypothetical protein